MRMLQTKVHYRFPFSLKDFPERFASVGSCFSEKIVTLLSNAGFQCCSNPNGTVYNPESISKSIRHIVEDIPYDSSDLFFHNDLWHSREHHGRFSSGTTEEVLRKAETERQQFREFLNLPCPVVLTFGTAVVYREKSYGKIVANCHKVPGTEFNMELLPVEYCRELICGSVKKLSEIKGHPVLLAVSPVRHHPGDPVLNTRSKSILIESCHLTTEKYPELCAYFPAYELLHDELRDYRFYDDDLVHPSAAAEEFILESFVKTCYPEKSEQILNEGWKNIKRSRHVPGGIR